MRGGGGGVGHSPNWSADSRTEGTRDPGLVLRLVGVLGKLPQEEESGDGYSLSQQVVQACGGRSAESQRGSTTQALRCTPVSSSSKDKPTLSKPRPFCRGPALRNCARALKLLAFSGRHVRSAGLGQLTGCRRVLPESREARGLRLSHRGPE